LSIIIDAFIETVIFAADTRRTSADRDAGANISLEINWSEILAEWRYAKPAGAIFEHPRWQNLWGNGGIAV